jgi:predicted RNA methylase
MPIDLDRPLRDVALLRTIPGAVDYLHEELRLLPAGAVSVIRRYRDALLIDYDGPLRPLAANRYFDALAVALFPDFPVRVRDSLEHGILGLLPERPAFRVGDLGDQRWSVRDELESDHGWVNNPSAWDLNVDAVPDGLVAEVGGLFLTSRFGRLLRAPASTNPVIGAILVRLAKIEPGQTLLDPFCGAGTLLVLAGEMASPGRLVGAELTTQWSRAARDNLAARDLAGTVLRSDAQAMPFAGESVQRIVSNLPFGKRVGSHRVNTELYPAALREMSRVLVRNGRAALLTEDKRLFREQVQRTPTLRVIKEIVLERGGLHPSAYVLVKRGSHRR